MKMNFSSFVVCLFVTSLLTACGGGGGGSGGSGTTTATEYDLSGAFQKGPFAIGSTISVNEQDENVNPSGKVYNIQTTDDLGNFAVATKVKSHLVEIIGDGFYMDELTGQLSLSRIQLRAVADLKVNPKVTVNILTSLQGRRLKKLISQGMSYNAANTQSQNEVLTAFGITPSKVVGLTNLYSMKINGSADADSVLLAISAILSKMATNAAVANGTTQPTELSNYVNTIASQIENSGAITLASYNTAMSLAATQIDLAAVRSNVETYYANRGITVVAPKFEEWVDKYGLGSLPHRLSPVTSLSFTNVGNAECLQVVTSNSVVISGLGAGVIAAASVNTGTTLIKNGVVASTTATTVQDGDVIELRRTSSGFVQTASSTISIGSSSSSWQISTRRPSIIYTTAFTGGFSERAASAKYYANPFVSGSNSSVRYLLIGTQDIDSMTIPAGTPTISSVSIYANDAVNNIPSTQIASSSTFGNYFDVAFTDMNGVSQPSLAPSSGARTTTAVYFGSLGVPLTLGTKYWVVVSYPTAGLHDHATLSASSTDFASRLSSTDGVTWLPWAGTAGFQAATFGLMMYVAD